MGFGKYARKIIYLLSKITNPPFFWYLLHHYLKKDVSLPIAKRISARNKKKYKDREREFVISTYDGSDQVVHPDMIYFANKYWLVVTPYPYGMEEYENPCIYCGEKIDLLVDIYDNPIKRQQKHEIGFHLSDPCIFEYKDRLVCAYRENTRSNSIESNYIHLKTIQADELWADSINILKSETDPLLSPAFYVENIIVEEKIYMIHVRREREESDLVLSRFNGDMQIVEQKTINCNGIPKGYYIWHIGVAYKDGRKRGKHKEQLYGLFLLRNKANSNDFRLYLSMRMNDSEWNIVREVIAPESIKAIEYHPYKSCFVPNSKKILYSYIDNKNRYRVTILDNLL